MKSIVIVAKVAFGFRGWPIGLDGNIMKKNSIRLRNDLRKRLREKGVECDVAVDNHTDIRTLKSSGADLILISPFIKSYIDVSEINEEDYCFISEEAFLSGDSEEIVDMLTGRMATA